MTRHSIKGEDLEITFTVPLKRCYIKSENIPFTLIYLGFVAAVAIIGFFLFEKIVNILGNPLIIKFSGFLHFDLEDLCVF